MKQLAEIADIELIRKFITWCADNDFNQSKMAELAKRSRQWASLIVRGEITTLSFDTRNRIRNILGIQ